MCQRAGWGNRGSAPGPDLPGGCLLWGKVGQEVTALCSCTSTTPWNTPDPRSRVPNATSQGHGSEGARLGQVATGSPTRPHSTLDKVPSPLRVPMSSVLTREQEPSARKHARVASPARLGHHAVALVAHVRVCRPSAPPGARSRLQGQPEGPGRRWCGLDAPGNSPELSRHGDVAGEASTGGCPQRPRGTARVSLHPSLWSLSPGVPGPSPSGKRPRGLLTRMQLDLPEQDTPGGPGLPGRQEPGRAPEGSAGRSLPPCGRGLALSRGHGGQGTRPEGAQEPRDPVTARCSRT